MGLVMLGSKSDQAIEDMVMVSETANSWLICLACLISIIFFYFYLW